MRESRSAAWNRLSLQGLLLGVLAASACSSELAVGAGVVEYTLRVTPPLGGTITSADGSIRCPGQCEISRPAGTRLQLTASADEGALFELWTAGCTGLPDPTCEVGFVEPLTAARRRRRLPPPARASDRGSGAARCGPAAHRPRAPAAARPCTASPGPGGPPAR